MNLELKIKIRKTNPFTGVEYDAEVDGSFDSADLKQWAQSQINDSFAGPGEVTEVKITSILT